MAKAKYTAIGGQALIEGIMMKSPEKTALAVRLPDGGIDISYLSGKGAREKYKILRLPIIRGIVGFAESMLQGYRAMMISAEKSGFADEEDEKQKSAQEGAAQSENEPEKSGAESEENESVNGGAAENSGKTEKKKSGEKGKNVLLTAAMAIGSVLGVALAVVLFMYIPRLIVDGIEALFKTEIKNPVLRSSIEQLIKLAVFVAYIWLVAFMKDIKRVFMYHGAEHKTIFCYEKGLPLTVENVRVQRRFHPRCGTSFMILMILISIIFATVLQMIFPGVYEKRALWVAAKILMIPLVCGAGFEVLRVCGKYDNALTRIISAPGLWLQRITTKEPDDGMIEIAIAALRACEPETPDVDRSIDREENAAAAENSDEAAKAGINEQNDI